MRYVIAATLAATVAACASFPTTGDISAKAKEIQNYTRLACSFVPTLGTVANILSSGAAAPAIIIANDICAAVTTAPLADGPRRGGARVYGVAIEGKFVK